MLDVVCAMDGFDAFNFDDMEVHDVDYIDDGVQ